MTSTASSSVSARASTKSDGKKEAKRDHLRGITVLLFLFLACLNVSSMASLRLALGAFAGLLLVIGLRDLRFLMLVMIALVPVQSSALGFGTVFGYQLTFNRVAVLIAVLCFLLHRSKYPRIHGRREPLLYMLLALFALSVLTDLLGDGSYLSGVQRTLSESVEVLLFAYICYRVFGPRELGSVTSAFATGGILLSSSVILERVTGMNLLFSFPVADEIYAGLLSAEQTLDRADTLRVRGSFQNPVYLSGFLPLLLFAAAYLLLVQRRRVLGGALLVLVVLTACFSISRTAIYALLIFGAPILIMTQMRRGVGRIIRFAALTLVLGGLLYAIFPSDLERAVTLTVNPYQASLGGSDTADRLDLITVGVPFVLSLNPFGSGFDRSQQFSLLLGPDIADFFIGYSIARGVIWVAAFCMLLAYMMWRTLRGGNMVSWMLFWLVVSISATYLGYAEYWISFPMLLVFVLVHGGLNSTSPKSQLLKRVVSVAGTQ